MTILLTGATGLVGTRLLRRLVDQGAQCRALMRGGKRPPAGAAAVAADLLDPGSLATAVAGVSAIIHLAAVFRTPDTDLIWASNLQGTRNLIAAAKAHAPQARFIMASTGQVYDEDTPRPGREGDRPDPKHAYPASKLAAENALRDSGLTWSVIRFPFVYGDNDGHLGSLPRLTANAGWHPARTMNVIHHRDVATAMRLALDGVMDGRIVNITDEAPMTIFELAELAGATMAPSSAPLTNPWHLRMDGSLARSLGFQPTVRTIHQAVQDGLL